MTHRVFSYGTLRLPDVQQALYGRRVVTVSDRLPGYRLDWLRITDPEVIEVSGSDTHPVLRPGERHELVEGAYLELTDAELATTDRYEVDDYVRTAVQLESGAQAWAYLGEEAGAGRVG